MEAMAITHTGSIMGWMSMVHPEALAIYAFARLRQIDSGENHCMAGSHSLFHIHQPELS